MKLFDQYYVTATLRKTGEVMHQEQVNKLNLYIMSLTLVFLDPYKGQAVWEYVRTQKGIISRVLSFFTK